ncbi:GNAT family N-acetyltransferase (plasmid) [Planococcus maritimus]|uniref:GNAT family N-acetyltransferase n=1 Tax=Planococcus maritimus TaxID=192421 RepID=UPI00313A20E0
MKRLETERIYLREFIESDWEGVYRYASQEQVSKHQTWEPNSVEESKEFVKQVLADSQNMPRTRFTFAIVLKKDKRMIGSGEISIRSFNNKTGEISYILNPDYWKKGIATEVAKIVIEFGFRELNLHRIFATCAPNNIGSQKVLEKSGMFFEGRMRENLLLKEGWRDSILYSALAYEWSSK